MRLIIIRHGQTAGNHENVLVGRRDTPLTNLGTRQAAALAQRLRSEHIDAIYASDLIRAQETARAIAKEHPDVPFVIDPRLRERDFGDLEGKPRSQLYNGATAAKTSLYRFKPANGESGVDVNERLAPLLDELFAQYHGKTVVLVSHSHTARTLLTVLLDLPEEKFVELTHSNTGFSIVDCHDRTHHVMHVFNDVSHLHDVH